MKNHMLWMMIACGIPLLLIFMAPSFGLTGNWEIFIFLVVMFGLHLLMPHHQNGHSDLKDESREPK